MRIPQISIIIPAYNAEKYIAETIESAVAQTVEDFEIVIVDDGSTDSTSAIIKTFSSCARIRAYAYGKNRGAAHAYNYGILHSTGEYVTFLDADDIFLPRYCETVLAAMIAANADMGYANLYAMDGREAKHTTLYGKPRDARFQGIFGGPEAAFPKDPFTLRQFVLQGVHISPRAIYRRSLFLDYGLEDHRLKITHDWLRHITFVLSGATCAFVDEPLGFYRFHPEGNSQRDALGNSVENIKVLEIVLQEKASLLSESDTKIVRSMLRQQRMVVFQALADSNFTTSNIIQYLADKRF